MERTQGTGVGTIGDEALMRAEARGSQTTTRLATTALSLFVLTLQQGFIGSSRCSAQAAAQPGARGVPSNQATAPIVVSPTVLTNELAGLHQRLLNAQRDLEPSARAALYNNLWDLYE